MSKQSSDYIEFIYKGNIVHLGEAKIFKNRIINGCFLSFDNSKLRDFLMLELEDNEFIAVRHKLSVITDIKKVGDLFK